MANVQIRDVPEDVHAKLKERAEVNGQSLNEYLRRELEQIAALPTWAEMTDRIRQRPPYTGPSSASVIREDRDSH